jgi:coproporphyrinogen III oxidase-like Fe-S oxidoreductase
VDGQRSKNWSNTVFYCEELEKGRRAIESRDVLPPLQRAGEIAAFGLRMNAGWRFPEFHRATSFDLKEHWRREMTALRDREWAVEDDGRFYLNATGLRFADAVAEMFLKS